MTHWQIQFSGNLSFCDRVTPNRKTNRKTTEHSTADRSAASIPDPVPETGPDRSVEERATDPDTQERQWILELLMRPV